MILIITALAVKSNAGGKAVKESGGLSGYKTAVDASNNLNSVIFQDLSAEKKDQNIFFSSYSVVSALNLAYAGATEVSKAEFENIYGIPAQNNLHESYANLVENLKINSGDNQLLNANALWVDNKINLLPEFVALTKKFYNTSENKVDFAKKEQAAETINKWVAENTKQLIKKLVGANDFNEYTRLVLTNAIYFKSVWRNEFDASKTEPRKFILLDGSSQEVSMMSDKFYLKFAEEKSYKVAELHYKNSSFSMLVFLPNEAKSESLDNLIANLPKNITEFDNVGVEQSVFVGLPKFKFETAIEDFSEILKKNGLAVTFSDDAKFGNITHDMPLKISKVLHKATIEVNEKGTEASAATAVMMMVGSAMPVDKPAEFYVDKPFVFVIRDSKTGLILFSGKIVNPSQS